MITLYRIQARTLERDIDQLFTTEKVAEEYRDYLMKNRLIGSYVCLGAVYVPETLNEVIIEDA